MCRWGIPCGTPPGSAAGTPQRPRLCIAEVQARQSAAVAERKARVIRDLPGVPVRIGEVAGVAAVDGVRGRAYNDGSGGPRRIDDRVDLVPRAHVVRQIHPAKTIVKANQTRADILGQLVLAPEHHAESASLEEDRLPDLLTAPAELLVERAGSRHVRHP